MAGKTIAGIVLIAGGVGVAVVAYKPLTQAGMGAVGSFLWNEFYHRALPAAGFPISINDSPYKPGTNDTSNGMCANAQATYDQCLQAGGSKGGCFTQVAHSYPGCGVQT